MGNQFQNVFAHKLHWRQNGCDASQITSLTIVYSTVYSGTDQRKKSKLWITGLCARNSPVTGEFPAQMASNTENVSIWWCHHASIFVSGIYQNTSIFMLSINGGRGLVEPHSQDYLPQETKSCEQKTMATFSSVGWGMYLLFPGVWISFILQSWDVRILVKRCSHKNKAVLKLKTLHYINSTHAANFQWICSCWHNFRG